MRILYITNITSPYRMEFFRLLGERTELTVCFERKNANNRDESWTQHSVPITFKKEYLRGINYKEDGIISLDIISKIKHYKNSTIIVANYTSPTCIFGIIYMILKKIPYIITADGGIIKNDYKIIYRIKKLLMSHAKAWIVSGEMTKRYVEYYGAVEKRILFVPFTSILEKDINYDFSSKKESCRIQLGLLEKKRYILFVGQIIKRKGIDILNKVARILGDEYVFIVIGGDKQQYIDLFEENPEDNVIFVGFKDKITVTAYYNACDVFFLPTREDIWGLVINEAMANGLPIIASTTCVAAKELVEPGVNGFLYKYDDIDGFAKSIREVAEENISVKFGQQSIDIIKNYTIENMVSKHIAALYDL